MKYMLLIYGQRTMYEHDAADLARFDAFMAGRGLPFRRHLLHTPDTATALSRDTDGDWSLGDGPYASSDPAEGSSTDLAGICLFEARDLDDALFVARQFPEMTGLEVRPVCDLAPDEPA